MLLHAVLCKNMREIRNLKPTNALNLTVEPLAAKPIWRILMGKVL